MYAIGIVMNVEALYCVKPEVNVLTDTTKASAGGVSRWVPKLRGSRNCSLPQLTDVRDMVAFV